MKKQMSSTIAPYIRLGLMKYHWQIYRSGATRPGVRKFRIRRKDKQSFEYGDGNPCESEIAKKFWDIEMPPQMCLVMTGNFQREFTHEIPKQVKVEGPRLSCTFRTHTQ